MVQENRNATSCDLSVSCSFDFTYSDWYYDNTDCESHDYKKETE